ncbi:hypothetical protein LOK49_LG04G00214 [Camellia lanceoleosa]|uniref:Uncharacterized protein n=1 Tax=Camellia lanceoleosa TaxID=1840588 RepID=A0ACC0HVM8_9ERIC|nr:hypothetical protein LOK49_LG04G00214 [Camellia lanceoleosa]
MVFHSSFDTGLNLVTYDYRSIIRLSKARALRRSSYLHNSFLDSSDSSQSSRTWLSIPISICARQRSLGSVPKSHIDVESVEDLQE